MAIILRLDRMMADRKIREPLSAGLKYRLKTVLSQEMQ